MKIAKKGQKNYTTVLIKFYYNLELKKLKIGFCQDIKGVRKALLFNMMHGTLSI